jgi:hypothetical protein
MSIRPRSEVALIVLLAIPAPSARAAPPASSAATAQDPLTPYRERFKLGMDRYKAGAIADAVATWEPIYRDIGPVGGYRLAYNLGVAYAELGDPTRAAERLRSFLDEVDTRRARGERLEARVMMEESDARTRIASLVPTKDRMPLEDAGPAPHPGDTVEAGPTPGPAALALTPAAGLGSAPVHAPAPALAALPSAPAHPFPAALLYASGGVTLAASVAAIALEANANALRGRLVAEHDATGTISPQDRDTFSTTRTWSYAAVGVAIGGGAVTASLLTWYLLGTSRHEAPVVATVSAARTGGSLALSAPF